VRNSSGVAQELTLRFFPRANSAYSAQRVASRLVHQFSAHSLDVQQQQIGHIRTVWVSSTEPGTARSLPRAVRCTASETDSVREADMMLTYSGSGRVQYPIQCTQVHQHRCLALAYSTSRGQALDSLQRESARAPQYLLSPASGPLGE
jgi:hypothetical protein